MIPLGIEKITSFVLLFEIKPNQQVSKITRKTHLKFDISMSY